MFLMKSGSDLHNILLAVRHSPKNNRQLRFILRVNTENKLPSTKAELVILRILPMKKCVYAMGEIIDVKIYSVNLSSSYNA